jgi:hypothetical protein
MQKNKYPIRNNGMTQSFELKEMKIEIDGMKVIFEKKVALMVVDVTENKLK